MIFMKSVSYIAIVKLYQSERDIMSIIIVEYHEEISSSRLKLVDVLLINHNIIFNDVINVLDITIIANSFIFALFARRFAYHVV